MLFHFLNFSQCVVCMFGQKTIYKFTNLKVHSKGRYFVFKKNPFSRTTPNSSFGLQSCCPVFVTSQIVNPAYGNSNGWWVGRTLIEHCRFQNRNPVWVFLYHLISDGNQLFSENFGCHFHFILHIMSDKAAFVRGALSSVLCTALPGKPRSLPLQQRLPLAESEFAV